MRTIQALSCLTLASLAVGGCASTDGRYPSLEIRNAERVAGTFEPAEPVGPPPAPEPPAAELLERLAQLRGQAASAHSAFTEASPRASRLVRSAAGAGIASDRWAEAQVALADLDSHRSNAAIPLGDLDLLYVDASIALEQRTAIEETRAAVIAMIAEEDVVLERLRGQI